MSFSIYTLFRIFVTLHIVTGASGLVSFWVPIIARKGGTNHRKWGRIFTFLMVATGCVAVCIALTTISDPVTTHPHLKDVPGLSNPAIIRGIFGWMMLFLAILTVNLAWYGWMSISNKHDHLANRAWPNLALQAILTVAALNCAIQGYLIGQYLMIGISIVGFATAGTNLWFIFNPKPAPFAWLNEHIKALVGAGISVYTAFFAFGAVRYFPSMALHPTLWAIPLVTGLVLIIYHQAMVRRRYSRRTVAAE